MNRETVECSLLKEFVLVTGKILVHQQKAIESEYFDTLEFWLKLLPNENDLTEAKDTTSLLLTLVERYKQTQHNFLIFSQF
jgi:hypothetical protein